MDKIITFVATIMIAFSTFFADAMTPGTNEIQADNEWMKTDWNKWVKRRVIPMYSNNEDFFRAKYSNLEGMTFEQIIELMDTVSNGTLRLVRLDDETKSISFFSNNDMIEWDLEGSVWMGTTISTPGEKFNKYLRVGMDYEEVFNYPFLMRSIDSYNKVQEWKGSDWYVAIQHVPWNTNNPSESDSIKFWEEKLSDIVLKFNEAGKVESIMAGASIDFYNQAYLSTDKSKHLTIHTDNKDLFKSDWTNFKLSDVLNTVKDSYPLNIRLDKKDDGTTHLTATHSNETAWFTMMDDAVKLDSIQMDLAGGYVYYSKDTPYLNPLKQILDLPDLNPSAAELKQIVESWNNEVASIDLIYDVPENETIEESEMPQIRKVRIYYSTEGYVVGFRAWTNPHDD